MLYPMMDPHSAYSKQEKTFIDYSVIYVCLFSNFAKKKKKSIMRGVGPGTLEREGRQRI